MDLVLANRVAIWPWWCLPPSSPMSDLLNLLFEDFYRWAAAIQRFIPQADPLLRDGTVVVRVAAVGERPPPQCAGACGLYYQKDCSFWGARRASNLDKSQILHARPIDQYCSLVCSSSERASNRFQHPKLFSAFKVKTLKKTVLTTISSTYATHILHFCAHPKHHFGMKMGGQWIARTGCI